MEDDRAAKKWKVMEVMLIQAAELLHQSKEFKLLEQSREEYRYNTRENELREAMIELENIARRSGAKSGFWRRIKKAAMLIEDADKINEYEELFNTVLAKKVYTDD